MSKSLKRNFFYQAAWQLLQILTPLVTTPYLSRVLGASQVGVYSYTSSVAGYFVMFAMLGMSKYDMRAIAACGADRTKRSRTFWEAYLSQLAVSLLVSAVYGAYILSEPAGGSVVAAVWGMWVLSAAFDVSWLMFGVEEFKVPTVRSIVTKLLGLAVIFVFVRGPEDLWVYCASIAGASLLNQLLLWPFVPRHVDPVGPSPRGVLSHVLPSLRLFVPVVAISFYTMLDKVMLGLMGGGMVQVGYYEYSEKLSKMPLALVTAMGTVMLPRMTAELGKGDRRKALSLLENSMWAMLATAFALMFGIVAVAPEFAPVFLGEEFASCDTTMCILALVIPVISATNALGEQYLLPTGRDVSFTLSVCVGAAVNVLANLVLIPRFAAQGAAVATVCAEVAVLVVQALLVRRELPLARYLKNAVPFAVCGLLMMLAVRASAGAFCSLWGACALGLVLEVLVGGIVFVVLAFAWCAASGDSHLKSVVSMRPGRRA